MDLNKDNKDIYTFDRESYSAHMQENKQESKDLLITFIKILLMVLLILLSYFFYRIVQAKQVSTSSEIPSKTAVLSASTTHDTVMVEQKEEVVELKEESFAEEVIIKDRNDIQNEQSNKVLKVEEDTLLSTEYLDKITQGLEAL